MRVQSLTAVVCLSASSVFGCINGYQPIPGVFVEDSKVGSLGYTRIDRDELTAFILNSSTRCAGQLDKSCNDLVIALIYNGGYSSGLDLSTRLAKIFPDEYNVVITHAAALELNGMYEESLSFMKRAIKLNPRSHLGSEWIHVNILEHLISDRFVTPDPAEIIGVDLRPGSVLTNPNHQGLDSVLEQLHYQINDRLFFAQERMDPLFGAMLYAYADLLFLKGEKLQAAQFYEFAEEYKFLPKQVSARKAIARRERDSTIQKSEENDLKRAEKARKEEAQRQAAHKQGIIDEYLANEAIHAQSNQRTLGWVVFVAVIIAGGLATACKKRYRS